MVLSNCFGGDSKGQCCLFHDAYDGGDVGVSPSGNTVEVKLVMEEEVEVDVFTGSSSTIW